MKEMRKVEILVGELAGEQAYFHQWVAGERGIYAILEFKGGTVLPWEVYRINYSDNTLQPIIRFLDTQENEPAKINMFPVAEADNEKYLEVAKRIKDFCTGTMNCGSCPFRRREGKIIHCRLDGNIPEEWELEE